ncbi:hypothetical protein JCM8547_004589 [Rhodosporidiobolus lusitaniae]
MPRFVMFDGAPTVAHLLATVERPSSSRGTWRTLPLRPRLPSTSPRKDPQASPPAVELQIRDADTTAVLGEQKEQSKRAWEEHIASQFADADVTGLFSSRGRDEVLPSSIGEDEGVTEEPPKKHSRRLAELVKQEAREKQHESSRSGQSLLLPPPSQPRARPSFRRPTQQSQLTRSFSHLPSFRFPATAPPFDVTDASAVYTDDGSTVDGTFFREGKSMGAPPQFEWEVHGLTQLNQLRTRVGKKVSIVASVIDYKAAQEGSTVPSTVNLLDHTGQPATLVVWKDFGRQLLQVIRRSDILYLGDLFVKEYQGAIQPSYSETSSRCGICWRGTILDEDDYAYRFDEGWREHQPQAKVVLKEWDFLREAVLGIPSA